LFIIYVKEREEDMEKKDKILINFLLAGDIIKHRGKPYSVKKIQEVDSGKFIVTGEDFEKVTQTLVFFDGDYVDTLELNVNPMSIVNK